MFLEILSVQKNIALTLKKICIKTIALQILELISFLMMLEKKMHLLSR